MSAKCYYFISKLKVTALVDIQENIITAAVDKT